MAPTYLRGRLMPAMPTKRYPEAGETYNLGRSFALVDTTLDFPDRQIHFSEKIRIGSHRVPQEFVAKSKTLGEVFVRVYDPLYVSKDRLLPVQDAATTISPSAASPPTSPDPVSDLPVSSLSLSFQPSSLQFPAPAGEGRQTPGPTDTTSPHIPEGLWSRQQIIESCGKIVPVASSSFDHVSNNQPPKSRKNRAPLETRAALAFRYFDCNLRVFQTLNEHHPAFVPKFLGTAVIRFQRELPEDESCCVLITEHTPGQRLYQYLSEVTNNLMRPAIFASVKHIIEKCADVDVFFAHMKLSQFVITPERKVLLVEMGGGEVMPGESTEYKKRHCEFMYGGLLDELNIQDMARTPMKY
jgi:hypothetical protein